MTTRTKSNLLTALDCDAISAAKYERFAARARMDEDWRLAQAFQIAADDCRAEHMAATASIGAVTDNSLDNLRAAIEAEVNQIRMYTRFAREAEDEGDLCLAATFDNIVQDRTERVFRFTQVREIARGGAQKHAVGAH